MAIEILPDLIMSKPTLVLVHGSFHTPEHFGPLIADLNKHNYKCIAVRLPTAHSPKDPPPTLTDDTAVVRKAVVDELDQGRNVVVIAHSYGGVVTNNSLRGLCTKDRIAEGHSTSVLAIAFLCAILIPQGKSLTGTEGGKRSAMHDMREPNFSWVTNPGHYFYNDLPTVEAKKWSDLLQPQSWLAYTEETTYAACMDIPSSYLYCTKDQTLVYDRQKVMVEAASARGAQIVYTETVESSHSPFLSMPERTSEFIRKVAGG